MFVAMAGREREEEQRSLAPIPPAIREAVQDTSSQDEDTNSSKALLLHTVWAHLELESISQPFELPVFNPKFRSIPDFVEKELLVQAEIWRNDIDLSLRRVQEAPKPANGKAKAEKYASFAWPGSYAITIRNSQPILELEFGDIKKKEPSRGMFTNYVVVLQKMATNGSMHNLALAHTEQFAKKGVRMILGSDYQNLEQLSVHTTVYLRCLKNTSREKSHLLALAALHRSQEVLNGLKVTEQLLSGQLDPGSMKTERQLDQWIKEKTSGCSLEGFNQQQKRALALADLTSSGVVLIQGPPGTGKSHTICHGIIPQAVGRDERILVLCNSNVAVDALMLKCMSIASLTGRMIRCGFKAKVSQEIIDMDGLFAEDIQNVTDSRGYFKTNTDSTSSTVQEQIRSKQVVFSTIHFASKEKENSDTLGTSNYWAFDTIVLDEAAQIEDSKVFNILARCQSLKRLILVGDPKQIQPYVPSSLRDQKYGQSAMERLLPKVGRDGFVMLEEQFRMAPIMREIVSNLYYDNRLQDGQNVIDHGPRPGVNLKPILLINVTGSKMNYSLLHHSYENKSEAQVCKSVYEFLLGKEFIGVLQTEDLYEQDICILTPFNRHKDQLRMRLCGVEEDALDSFGGQTYPTLNVVSSTLGSPSKRDTLQQSSLTDADEINMKKLESIDTVDKFQGSERKIVMVSTCVDRKPLRAADPHFINVACSRAQHLLVVVGNFSENLGLHSEDWKFIWQRASEVGSVIDHQVTMYDNAPEGQDPFDIHESDLLKKLRELIEDNRKRKERT